eukprot:Gregarina_sp_Poly_1__8206@NODE_476_length_8095_cov_200_606004_g385_i0_p2_GENE_NODE_476_length_8095_cov_200_606004_g385_i0NODE_476_length_8095_cov_200_606004_g385_i0_p2_ORF_typecomplete_len542_score97_05DEAD/PF00270_29/6e50DEAD/PF00270_29/9_3e03Helicase_C/PF00271_31/3_7e03Helicase_C/PF00271_31/9_8e03Helicase_C/PF00271_31/1_9e27DUF4217/PF13959_6/8_2e17ResIII/PF04851_15/6_4e13ERCC3_RAD25_C/PF16203_5/1_1e03ERCC3_RAD25_C/PF16203_5/8_3e12SecA_DEAD/PF07517_14/0_003SNF2_N/PF00176_23/0_0048UTP25/PF06862_
MAGKHKRRSKSEGKDDAKKRKVEEKSQKVTRLSHPEPETPTERPAETPTGTLSETTAAERRHGIEQVTAIRHNSSSILTEHEFGTHPDIHANIKKGIEAMGLKFMTQIQHATINVMLEGRDVLGSAKTGSGKTLAFIVPALNLLLSGIPITSERGTIALVIAPTRELVEQIYDVAKQCGQFMTHTIGAVTGGTKKRIEAEHLAKGVSLLVATPGRLLDHLEHAHDFVYSNLKLLILDEADRMLEVGFQDELQRILAKLPRKGRQTALFSATVDKQLQEIIRLNMKKPVLVKVSDSESATVEGVQQGYVHVSPEIKASLLFRLLRKKYRDGEKVMVFFSTCNSVQFHEDILNYLDLPCVGLHGDKKQNQRSSIYNNFMQAEKGVLLCTNVAARGLDFPGVHCIIQYDPPDSETEYIHRVGRTGRGGDASGSGLLFLLSEEIGFLGLLERKNVRMKEFTFKPEILTETYRSIAKHVRTNFHLAELARKAYRSYLLAYSSHALKNIFNVNSLDVKKVANGFGMDIPPRVDLNINPLKKNKKRKK